MDTTLDEIKEVIGEYTPVNYYISAHCPFHEDDTKSLLVFPDGFRCLSHECGAHGSLSYLYKVIENGDLMHHRPSEELGIPPRLPTDRRELSEMALRAHQALMYSEEFRWYPRMRGVEGMIERAQLGWYYGWITIPVFNRQHELEGLYMRATPPEQKRTGRRFHQPDGQRPLLFCPDWGLLKLNSHVVVVFGAMDALVLSSLQVPVVTTTGGSGSFNPDWLNDMRKPIYIIPDEHGDDMAALELSAALGWRGIIIRLPYDEEVHDPADYAKEDVNRQDELVHIVKRKIGTS